MGTISKSFLEVDAWPENQLFFKGAHKLFRGSSHPYAMAYRHLLDYCFGLYEDAYYYIPVPFSFPKDIKIRFDRFPSFHCMKVYDMRCQTVMLVQIMDKKMELERKTSKPLGNVYRFADEAMRAMFAVVREEEKCPLPTLFGLSFVDTSLRVYSCDKESNEISPPSGTRPPTKSDWEIDLLSQDGFKKMQSIVKFIRDTLKL